MLKNVSLDFKTRDILSRYLDEPRRSEDEHPTQTGQGWLSMLLVAGTVGLGRRKLGYLAGRSVTQREGKKGKGGTGCDEKQEKKCHYTPISLPPSFLKGPGAGRHGDDGINHLQEVTSDIGDGWDGMVARRDDVLEM